MQLNCCCQDLRRNLSHFCLQVVVLGQWVFLALVEHCLVCFPYAPLISVCVACALGLLSDLYAF